MKRYFVSIFTSILLLNGALFAGSIEIPALINYQGFAADSEGIPFGNTAPENFDVLFRLYDNQTGGTVLWGESQTVTIVGGQFSVLLGNGTMIDGSTPHGDLAALFSPQGITDDAPTVFLGITVNPIGVTGESEVTPRQQIVANPFALRAGRADVAGSVVDGSIGTDAIADGAITGLDLGINSINGTHIFEGTINDTHIADNTINGTHIADGTLNGTHIADGTLTGADLNTPLTISGGIRARGGLPATTGGTGTGYAFSSDADTGMFLETNGQLALYANGMRRLVIRDNVFSIRGLTPSDQRNLQWNPSTGQVFFENSSRRYKENIQPLEDEFAQLLKAEPKTYTRPGDPNRWEIGFIAEEIDELGLEPLVEYDEEGRPDGVRYDKITLYLLELIKRQHAVNADLSERVERLEQLVNQLSN